jgi:hypothetical protein
MNIVIRICNRFTIIMTSNIACANDMISEREREGSTAS